MIISVNFYHKNATNAEKELMINSSNYYSWLKFALKRELEQDVIIIKAIFRTNSNDEWFKSFWDIADLLEKFSLIRVIIPLLFDPIFFLWNNIFLILILWNHYFYLWLHRGRMSGLQLRFVGMACAVTHLNINCWLIYIVSSLLLGQAASHLINKK